MVAERPRLREEIARQLRQEAGFGCCICGFPFIEYHHIDGWQVTGDDPAKMMALCPSCHARATANALPKEDQYAAKASPHNVRRKLATGALHVGNRMIAIVCGPVEFVATGQKLLVDGEMVLELEISDEGRLLITFDLLNREGQLLARVERNEWVTGDALPWDFQYKFNWLRLRQKHGEIAVEVDARGKAVQLRGTLWRNGAAFRIMRHRLELAGTIKTTFSNLALVNTSLNICTDGRTQMIPVKGKISGIVSGSNPAERLRRAIAFAKSEP